MNNVQNISDLLSLNNIFSVPDLGEFLLNTLLLLVLAQILAYVYRKFGQTLSNRRKLASLFPLLAITTMMIISIISGSIALSLGLVGALSIVRFRSAIKEPEELAYIFLAISLGLGMGAGQRELTVAFFLVAMVYIVVKSMFGHRIKLPGLNNDEKIYLEITTDGDKHKLTALSELISPYTSGLELKRMDTSGDSANYYFLAWIPDYEKLTALTGEIQKMEPSAKISILNEDTLFS